MRLVTPWGIYVEAAEPQNVMISTPSERPSTMTRNPVPGMDLWNQNVLDQKDPFPNRGKDSDERLSRHYVFGLLIKVAHALHGDLIGTKGIGKDLLVQVTRPNGSIVVAHSYDSDLGNTIDVTWIDKDNMMRQLGRVKVDKESSGAKIIAEIKKYLSRAPK